MGGLIEIVLVCCFVLGFGFIELRSLRRDKKKAEEKAQQADVARTRRDEGEQP